MCTPEQPGKSVPLNQQGEGATCQSLCSSETKAQCGAAQPVEQTISLAKLRQSKPMVESPPAPHKPKFS